MANPSNFIGQAVPDITAAFTPPTNDPLLPGNMGDGAAALRKAYANAMNQGSFAGRHGILSTILGSLAGAALGGIAGGMDDSVGAGRGALLGALMGGATTPLLERQRKAKLGESYLTMMPKLAENQKALEDIRKGRAGGELLRRASEGVPLADLTKNLPLDAETLKTALDLQQGGASRGYYQTLMTPNPQVSGIQAALNMMSQPKQSAVGAAMQQAAHRNGLEADPSVSQPMAPLQGGAAMQAAPPTFEGPIIGASTLKDLAALYAPAITSGVKEGVGIPESQAVIGLRNAQAKAMLETLPSEIKLNLAREFLARKQGELAGKTNPNLRSGGGPRNADMGPINSRISALKGMLGYDDLGEVEKSLVLRELQRLGGIPEQQASPAPSGDNGFGWLGNLFNGRR